MKRLFLACLLSLWIVSAWAVDLTISFTISDAQRIALAIGQMKGYVDANGVPRAATMAEAKAFFIERAKAWVVERERNTAIKAIAAPTPIAPN